MEKIASESNQWEQSKENIQPLKQGRRANVLSVVLSDNAAQKLNIMRHEFEEKLRTYSGEDPLEVWYEYVLWVEQNYPKGGKEGKLTKLIEKCLMAMYSSADLREKYVNDQRFLDIWIKYANLSPNPLEIYQTMEAKGLCLSLADFYITWAWEMEKAGNFKRAEAVFEKGLQVGAKPLCSLQESQKKFQIRVARSTIEGRLDDQAVNSSEQERVALGSLKPQGQRISVNRSGSALIGPAGRCHQDLTSKQNVGPTFSILKDTSSKGIKTSAPLDEKQRGALGIGHSSNLENIRKPSQWTKAKVHQKTKEIVPVEDIDKYQMPKFSVHEDEDSSQKRGSQARLSHASNVLSVHKEEYDNWHVQLFIPEPFDPKVQPQYCKHKVYCGTEEFSFEELRAAQFAKKERERKEKEYELQQLREMLKKHEELIQKLLQGRGEENKQDNSSKVEAPPKLQATSQQKELKLLDESGNALLQCEQLPNTGCSRESSVSSNRSPATTIAPCTQEHVNLSTSGNSRGLSFSDPTGDATNIMNDLWSASLSHSASQQMTDRVGISEQPLNETSPFPIHEDGSKSQQLVGGDSATPFPIFSDPMNQNKKMETLGMPQSARVLKEKVVTEAAVATVEAEATATTAGAEMIVSAMDHIEKYPENQDENCPPPGLVQHPCETRRISGILVPAKDIPFLKDQENQEVNKSRNETKWNANDVESLYASALKNDDLDDIMPLDGRQLEDFTIKMPNNLETFTHMAKVASTPVPWSQECIPHSPSIKNNYSIAIGISNNHFPLIQEEEDASEPLKGNGKNVELMPPPLSTKAHSTSISAGTTSITSSQYLHEPEAPLSPIMEASQEFRSSSSSSGSCTTPRGQSVHGLSQPGNFSLSSTTHMSRIRHHSHPDQELVGEPLPPVQPGDFTKSGYLADRSRGESLADSLPYTSGAVQPVSKGHALPFIDVAAEMVLDFKDMVVPAGDAEDKKIEIQDAKEKGCDLPRNINPFDENVLEQILSNLEMPLNKRGGYVAVAGSMPCLKAKLQVTLGKETFHIFKVCGEGAYAKAYRAITMDPLNVTLMSYDMEEDDKQQVILKVQKPACPWEFYICHELRQRLKASGCSDTILDSVMKVDRGYFFSNGSVLANRYHKYGTLLDAVNRYRAVGLTLPEEIAMYFMVEILSILEAVHSCNIIHADIKPDNFLLQAIDLKCDTTSDIFTRGPVCLKLIDFGRSIDMKAFPEGTTFTEVVTTEKFTCCEMMERRPWTYQTDYFGAAAIAHLFLFGSYMDLRKTASGIWGIKGTFKRYWKKDLWEMLFSTLLNVPSCSSLLNLSHIKQEIITAFHKAGMHKDIKGKFLDFSKQITQL